MLPHCICIFWVRVSLQRVKIHSVVSPFSCCDEGCKNEMAWHVTGKDEAGIPTRLLSAESCRGYDECDLNYGGWIV